MIKKRCVLGVLSTVLTMVVFFFPLRSDAQDFYVYNNFVSTSIDSGSYWGFDLPCPSHDSDEHSYQFDLKVQDTETSGDIILFLCDTYVCSTVYASSTISSITDGNLVISGEIDFSCTPGNNYHFRYANGTNSIRPLYNNLNDGDELGFTYYDNGSVTGYSSASRLIAICDECEECEECESCETCEECGDISISTSTIESYLLDHNDISLIPKVEMTYNASGTLESVNYTLQRVYFLLFIVIAIPFIWIGHRIYIEFIIRYRKQEKQK